VATFGLVHIGVNYKGHEYPTDEEVMRGYAERFDTGRALTSVVDVREVVEDRNCPRGHTGLHVAFMKCLVRAQFFPDLLKHIKHELRIKEAVNRADKPYVLGVYCKGGTHRSVVVGSVLPYLSALNIEEAVANKKNKFEHSNHVQQNAKIVKQKI